MNEQDKATSSSDKLVKIEDLVKTNQLLESEKKSLETIIFQERDFIAKVVHEARCHVRGILWGLNSLFHVIDNPGRKAEYEKLLSYLKESTLKYKNLLHNLTDYSFNQYGRKITIKMEPVLINGYLHSIADEFNDYLAEIGHTLHVQYAEPVFEANLDIMRFSQVVQNLIFNATQHGESGIINLAVYTDNLAKMWHLTICNPYKQLRQKENNANANQGLGLAISRQLIELMNGTIEINAEGQLFTVSIRLPLP
ncbi:sensor histidine kinase [Pseudoflavitalea rhizosphaerae]|uniref:sensor histidine kinase n=1 Tax=Pseudoflavitalea rhizosphaerae TaxID=1884793 RepID=UPI000F8F02B9|nr:HAMP domain-containing sensor histidine kinase [Pseudoflavitalea rhizosphaerae]